MQERLEQQKAELTDRVNKIKADITSGLEADSKEQAAQLENQEVLDALANEGIAELAKITAALQGLEVLTGTDVGGAGCRRRLVDGERRYLEEQCCPQEAAEPPGQGRSCFGSSKNAHIRNIYYHLDILATH